MAYWNQLPKADCAERVFAALGENVDFATDMALGYPVSRLDERVFHDAPFLRDAPLLSAYVANPNHIGCHTVGDSEVAFKGTQQLEREVLDMVAVDLLHAVPGAFDGYVASGGTEANIQALWMYRNCFLQQGARPDQIAIIASEDTHYSIAKGANLLMLDWLSVPVGFDDRKINPEVLAVLLEKAVSIGKRYFIVVANMGTTMFGSVDDPAVYTSILKEKALPFYLHVDGAYGGFIYPLLSAKAPDFSNPDVSSMTVDAHKMLQAPYGTGIFICRKNLIGHTVTQEAGYVKGLDLTLSGSRSGANVIAVWLILKSYGHDGWFEKVKVLQMRTDWFCKQLDAAGVAYFREPAMNIVTIRAAAIPVEVARAFDLVPQQHDGKNDWCKVVVMEHVSVAHLARLLGAAALKDTQTTA